MVTSTSPAEGKSSSALSLAQNFARRGENVLLIDADLREPASRPPTTRQGLTKLLTNDERAARPCRADPIRQSVAAAVRADSRPTRPTCCRPRASTLIIARGRRTLRPRDHRRAAGARAWPTRRCSRPPPRTSCWWSNPAAPAPRPRAKGSSGFGRRARTCLESRLTKSKEEASGYGYRTYRYGAVDDRRDNLIMISNQSET